jgi:flagellar L-ring protein precursor FlgH
LSGRGSGSTRRDDRLAGVITARVQAIREDGGLELKGERAVDIDGELQRLTLKGVLRPEDVALDGSALSSRLAEAELKLNNSGSIARAGRLGWLQWILSWLGL